MNWKTLIFIITGYLLSSYSLPAQQNLEQFKDLFKPAVEQNYYQTRIDASNELRLLMTGAFAFYKKFISSQDGIHCVFYPSCSVYGLRTIQKNGILGIFDAIDRLTRCNGFSRDKYEIHPTTHLFYDEVKDLH